MHDLCEFVKLLLEHPDKWDEVREMLENASQLPEVAEGQLDIGQ